MSIDPMEMVDRVILQYMIMGNVRSLEIQKMISKVFIEDTLSMGLILRKTAEQ